MRDGVAHCSVGEHLLKRDDRQSQTIHEQNRPSLDCLLQLFLRTTRRTQLTLAGKNQKTIQHGIQDCRREVDQGDRAH